MNLQIQHYESLLLTDDYNLHLDQMEHLKDLEQMVFHHHQDLYSRNLNLFDQSFLLFEKQKYCQMQNYIIHGILLERKLYFANCYLFSIEDYF